MLGGGLRPPAPPRLQADFGDASDRVVHAARLCRAGKVKRVLITGGNIPWISGTAPEAEIIRDQLVEFGVPEAAIAFAGESRNTFENALEIQRLRAVEPFDTALLVTSALHMPRAFATFQKAGIPVAASSTDVRVIYKAERTIFDWLPDSEYLDLTTKALKEWIGFGRTRFAAISSEDPPRRTPARASWTLSSHSASSNVSQVLMSDRGLRTGRQPLTSSPAVE